MTKFSIQFNIDEVWIKVNETQLEFESTMPLLSTYFFLSCQSYPILLIYVKYKISYYSACPLIMWIKISKYTCAFSKRRYTRRNLPAPDNGFEMPGISELKLIVFRLPSPTESRSCLLLLFSIIDASCP